jgi:Raf kinase inhibitor-like YbhB/YbcL family protein
MPVELTCDGTNVSPSLEWTGVPGEAVELAITVTDPEAKGFVHWVLAGLPPGVRALGPGAVPEGAAEATNGAGTTGWTGPCPPQGPAHHYVFTLYALSAASGVTDGMPAAEAIVKITAAPVLATANLVGQYQRA